MGDVAVPAVCHVPADLLHAKLLLLITRRIFGVAVSKRNIDVIFLEMTLF